MKKFNLLLLLLVASISIYSQSYWTEIQSTEASGALNKSYFVDSENGWVVGQSGMIKHTTDGGENWLNQYQDNEKLFKSVYFIDEQIGWTVGWSNIMHTTDGGENWEEQLHPPSIGDFNDVFFINQDTGWIVGWYKIIFKTTDGGENWEKISNHTGGSNVYTQVRFWDSNNGILCGSSNNGGIIMITNDGGMNWTETTPENTKSLNALSINSLGEVFVCGSDGELKKSEDMGNTWINIEVETNYFMDIEFTNNEGYLLTRYGLLKSLDNGNTWEVSIWAPYFRDCSIGGNTLYGCGDNSSIYVFRKEVTEWEMQYFYEPLNFKEMAFFDNNNAYAITGSGAAHRVLKTTDGGHNWEIDSTKLYTWFNLLDSYDQTIIMIGANNTLLKSTDAGNNWESIDLPFTYGIYNDLSLTSENTAYLCNDSSTLIKTIDGGLSWTSIDFEDYHKFTISYFYDDNFGWLVDDYSGYLARTKDGGNSWTFMKVDESHTYVPSSIFFIDENNGYITSEMGYVYKSTDGGDTWEEVFKSETTYRPIFYFINNEKGYYFNKSQIYYTGDAGLNWSSHQTLSNGITCAFFHEDNSWIGGNLALMALNTHLTGIEENSEDKQSYFTIYPNPTGGEITLELPEESIGITTVFISDMQGKIIKVVPINSITKTIDLSRLQSGVYFVRISDGIKTGTKRIILN